MITQGNYTKKFSEILTKLRRNSEKTQGEIAESIGITRQSLSRYESGDRTPNIELLAKIADVFDVSTDYLLARNDDVSSMKKDSEKSQSSPNSLEYSGLSYETKIEILNAIAKFIINTANNEMMYNHFSILPDMIREYRELLQMTEMVIFDSEKFVNQIAEDLRKKSISPKKV